MKAHHGVVALLFLLASTSTNSGCSTSSGSTTGSDGGGETGGKAIDLAQADAPKLVGI